MKLGRNDRNKNLKIMGRLMHPNVYGSALCTFHSCFNSLLQKIQSVFSDCDNIC